LRIKGRQGSGWSMDHGDTGMSTQGAADRYALLRTDDNGVTVLVAEFDTREEAERRAVELARGGHKQHYFIEPVAKG
jgi:hypothetical protein